MAQPLYSPVCVGRCHQGPDRRPQRWSQRQRQRQRRHQQQHGQQHRYLRARLSQRPASIAQPTSLHPTRIREGQEGERRKASAEEAEEERL
ncbi:hypothetical protein K457DRAFT_138852 [Linnemannia elongata AG-77]|uniref:Uncharacterized protein n=1 Tax=Linnemannia elongata AG-77 TaxID=1314771 RepID=A0A197JT81_9FUNG|nr:hypothetical protein K457DRAFT_138852 [Linnemannia elongata AG-77]